MDIVVTIGKAIIDNAPQLVGFILPPFVEILNRDVKQDGERYFVSLMACAFVAILLHFNEITTSSPETIVTTAGIIFLESNTTYKLYFQDSGLRSLIKEKIGKKETLPG